MQQKNCYERRENNYRYQKLITMLNISENKVSAKLLQKYKTVSDLQIRPHYKYLNRIIAVVFIILCIILFIPWTQNISG